MRLSFAIIPSMLIVGCASSANPFEEAADGSINRDQFVWMLDQRMNDNDPAVLGLDRECTVDAAWQALLDNREAAKAEGKKVPETGLFNRESAVEVLLVKAMPECKREELDAQP